MKLHLYSAADVHRALPMAEAIIAVKDAYIQLSAGRVLAPLRTALDVSPTDVTLVMPFYQAPANGAGGALGLKLVSVFESNVPRGLPLIHSVVLAVDTASGAPLALIEGATLTAIRTGAASGAATDALARPDAAVATIFGSGAQARRQLEAVCTVRPIERVYVYSLEGAEAFAAEMAGAGPIPADVRVAANPREAVGEADVICTATTARTPVFDDADLRPGVHINAIGVFTPDAREIHGATVRRARVVVDSIAAALAEAGDLLIPLSAGEITRDHISTELGQILVGERLGRAGVEQITLFKSVGVAAQDAAAARVILSNGPALGLGTVVEL
jgi:ornithine cyclodeaminase